MSGGPKPILLKGTGVQRRRSRQPKLRKLKKTEKAEKVHKSSDNGNEDKKEGEKKSTALSRHSLSSGGSGASGDSGGLGGHKVPLCFIGSKRLRRVLLYLKNKRSHSLPTSSAASDSSGRVTVRHHPHDSHGTRTIRGHQRHPMRHELTDTHPSKTHEKTNTDILRTKSKNTRKVERSWIRV